MLHIQREHATHQISRNTHLCTERKAQSGLSFTTLKAVHLLDTDHIPFFFPSVADPAEKARVSVA